MGDKLYQKMADKVMQNPNKYLVRTRNTRKKIEVFYIYIVFQSSFDILPFEPPLCSSKRLMNKQNNSAN